MKSEKPTPESRMLVTLGKKSDSAVYLLENNDDNEFRDVPESVDILSRQPPELILKIFGFLPADSLSRMSQASTRMHFLATQDLLWKQLCKTRWSTKKHNPLTPHPHVEYTHILPNLDTSDKLAILRRRFIRETELARFSDLESADDESKIESDVVVELNNLVVTTTPIGNANIRVVVPRKCFKWQASYIAAEYDQSREILTAEELHGYMWLYQGD
ncbi:hypothetical protein HK100_003025 [Physocladia obscura]|uniref:F-box domain-containing protein n=1 Tax=Physocladia obscura TaxID=109957 RepID=A0AAD5SUN1_9FUNG|nr:hypothetical protein HK100_003025 [Physocladia obscura]